MTGSWRIGAFGADYVPIAPTTALAVILLNGGAWARSRWPESPTAARADLAATLAVGVWSALVLAQVPVGFEIAVERWLSGTAETVRGIPVGRMSALTAVTLLIVCGASLSHQPRLARPGEPRWVGPALSSLVTLTGLVVFVGYALKTPLLYGGKSCEHGSRR